MTARRLLLLPALLLVLAVTAAPAQGAGTGGVEVSPYPGVVDGRQVTAFHASVPSRGTEQVRYSLRNTTQKPATAVLYAASARRASDGFEVGDAGSSPYVRFPKKSVTLRAGEVRMATFEVQPGPDGRPDGEVYAAVVVEVVNGAITQRAATIVYLKPGRTVPLPLLAVLVAGGLLVVVGGGVVLVRRRSTSPA